MKPKSSPGQRTARPARPLFPFALVVTLVVVAVFAGARSARAVPLTEVPSRASRPLVAMPASVPTDQIIVQFAADADPGRLTVAGRKVLADRLSAAAGTPVRFQRPMSGGAYVLKLAAAAPEAQVAAYSRNLAALPEVIYAEPDARMQLVRQPQDARPLSANNSPDDTRYGEQWHYRYSPGSEEGINLEGAWDITTGAASVVAAVIDTGIRPHADLAGRVLPGYDFISDVPTANDGNGRDADPSDPGDWTSSSGQCYPGSPVLSSSWHGTHVAGTIGANANNASDVAGVNWAAKILPVRVLGTCGGFSSDIADGMRWAAGLPVPNVPPNPHKAGVLNLSLGGSGACSVTYQNAINDIRGAGVVIVVAAGNSAANASGFRPGNCNGVITVAATDRHGDLSWYSNYGSTIEISAPGGDTFFNDGDGILSTLNAGLQGPGADSLAFYQGTSMAAPHVAGLVSLMLGYQPDLTPDEVLDLLQSTARAFPNGSSCSPSLCGPGIADASAALSALEGALTAPELIAPADGATLDTGTPTLEWSAVNGANTYHVQVASDPGFSNIVMNKPALDVTSATPDEPLANGTYWWRARATTPGNNSTWSEAWSFTISVIECIMPGVPDLIAPSDGETTTDATPMFSWSPDDNATDYEIRIGQQPDVSDALRVGLPSGAAYTPDPLDPGQYYWMVRARNQANGCELVGDWSAVWGVTIEEPPSGEYLIALPAVLGE